MRRSRQQSGTQGIRYLLLLLPILATKLVITASEIITIVKPILEGIQHLAECGRVLATLTMNTIFFTQSGKVKIVGIEDSCEISAWEMDAATMKFPFPWESRLTIGYGTI
ncbi:hypothetical protein CBS147333_9517 [Penicillium roqueforti]|nr:hypothetical protein CBS147333_9517 [Penicillium roqueforti]KAI3274754.1 hypothetical protein CBS147308_2354 [Penicillium roqueforti]KAI3294078.1 hypothetical protein DTO003C3_2922 [Penicillium roqueforti]